MLSICGTNDAHNHHTVYQLRIIRVDLDGGITYAMLVLAGGVCNIYPLMPRRSLPQELSPSLSIYYFSFFIGL